MLRNVIAIAFIPIEQSWHSRSLLSSQIDHGRNAF
jgi:hypothetical protein